MYVSWTKIKPESRGAYARRMLVNAHLDERRRPYARKERNQADVPEVAVDPAVASDVDALVFRALGQLPAGMRAAVVLRHVLDVSVADTAEALGCSEGTVKSQTARGLAQLRAALSDDSAEPAPGSAHHTARKANSDD
jgi:RNA polymerase sigma factor (sigma-70 family)